MGTRYVILIPPQRRWQAGQPPTGLSLQSMGLEGAGCRGAGAAAGAAEQHWEHAPRQWCQTGTGTGACHLRQLQDVPCSWRGRQCPLSPCCAECPHVLLAPEDAFPFGKIVTEEAISLKAQAALRFVTFQQWLLCIYATT